jgi:hypothetical protein
LSFVSCYHVHIKLIMPFLYFATYRDNSNIYAKFGHCKDRDRLKAYRTTNPCLDYAMLEYNPIISNYKLLDNYIYSNFLRTCSIINFEHKSDWFYTQREKASLVLSYMRQLEGLYDINELHSFSTNILFILTTSQTPLEFDNIIRLKEAQMYSHWRPEYKHKVRTKIVNMCKSCEAKPAYSGCCSKYSQNNRQKVTVVIGWQQNADDPMWFGGMSKQYSNFFERNFSRGGMLLLKEAKKHIEWKESYVSDVEVKNINVCNSCDAKPAYSGCCPEYSLENRRKLRMIMGWS